MKKALIGTLLSVAIVICAVPALAADKPFTQFIPAESVELDGYSIEIADDVEGTIDGKAITCIIKGEDAYSDGFTLTFEVPKEGDYTIWGRVYYPSISNNSVYYSVDDEESRVWDFVDEDDENSPCYKSWQYFYLTDRVSDLYEDEKMYGPWTIENNEWRHTPNVLHLTAGLHSIHFAGRETMWYIDEFVITELSVEQYDPNAFDGNNSFAECKFCGTEWKHYCKDIFALTGQTAENYYNTVLYPAATATETSAETTAETAAESPEPEAPDETQDAEPESAPTAADSAVTTAPQTFDFGVAAVFAAVISALGLSLSRKK
ncbi:MAG: hypothetical protein ACI4XJ_09445 [Eubacteriales bacterium]